MIRRADMSVVQPVYLTIERRSASGRVVETMEGANLEVPVKSFEMWRRSLPVQIGIKLDRVRKDMKTTVPLLPLGDRRAVPATVTWTLEPVITGKVIDPGDGSAPIRMVQSREPVGGRGNLQGLWIDNVQVW